MLLSVSTKSRDEKYWYFFPQGRRGCVHLEIRELFHWHFNPVMDFVCVRIFNLFFETSASTDVILYL